MNLSDLIPVNQPLIATILSIAYLGLSVVLTIIQKKWPRFNNYYRRLVHVATGLYALLLYFSTTQLIFVIICSCYVVAMIVSKRINFFTHIHCVGRETYGEILFPLGIILSALIARENVLPFVCACLVLSFSDPLAGLMGDLSHSSKKTFLGSLVFFIATILIITTLLPTVPASMVAVMSLILTYLEMISSFGIDNLLIPVLVTIFLTTITF